jgi:polysaccharide export outer membrane protein
LFKTPEEIKTDKPVLVVNPEKKDTGYAYRHRIKPNDRLQIRFLNNYDIGQGAGQSATSMANNSMITGITDKGYLVNYDSTVTLPLIGRVNLVGLTRLEAAKKLEEIYGKFIINPIIDLNIASLSVTILGEVNIPGKILVDKESTTLIDVIALAGGLTINAKKNNLKIIRGNEIIVVDVRKIEVLKDPNIIIHDNDIIYIEPYGVKAKVDPISSIIPVGTIIVTLSQFTILAFQLYTYIRTVK